jgi:hypothetical protein
LNVDLTIHEARTAAMTGVERRIQSFLRPDNHGYDDSDGWTDDIEGAAGELAFAKLTRIYGGLTVDTFDTPDVGKVFVRTVSRDGLCLIIRPNAQDDQVFALMVGRCPSFRFGGWIFAVSAKRDEWWRAPNGRPGAWFVPESALDKRFSK